MKEMEEKFYDFDDDDDDDDDDVWCLLCFAFALLILFSALVKSVVGSIGKLSSA
jgi:hypothetical protein